MSIDSTAELLFKVNANADDATGNIRKFRTLLSKDLAGMEAEFHGWSKSVLGDFSTVQSAMLGGAAAVAAGALAVGAMFASASDKYVSYVSEVGRGSKMTGIQAEQMSGLHFAAKRVGVDYDTLINGLMKFSTTIVKASEGNEQAEKGFRALHISQKDVIAGQKDILPLLERVMDGFHGNTSAVQKAAIARELFSRSGTELLGFLNKGSEWLKQMNARATELGETLTLKDVVAVREMKIAQKELIETTQALDITMGKSTMGLRLWWTEMKMAALATLTTDSKLPLFAQFFVQFESAKNEIQRRIKAAKLGGDETPPIVGDKKEKIKEATQDWYGFSSILESVNTKIAAQGTKWDQLVQEIAHMNDQVVKAGSELDKLREKGTITAESYARETAILARLPDAIAQITRLGAQKIQDEAAAEAKKRKDALAEVHAELLDMAAQYESQGYAEQIARWNKEMDARRLQMSKKAALTEAEYALLDDITKAGLNRIATDQTHAYVAELEKLQQSMAQRVMATLYGKEQLRFGYEQDLRQFSAIEEAKVMKTAKTEAERATITAMFDTNRRLLLTQYQHDLQILLNSQGWQGVFGARFAAQVRQDEALTRQWATSTNQSLLMVKVSMQSLKETGRQAFEGLAQGMGSNIAQAIVYSKSIGDAMRSALASTLEAIAAECLTNAIYATGLGFLRLAQHDPVGAGAAFTAAAVFGSVGIAAGVAGKFIAPSQGSGSEASAGAAGASRGSAADSGSLGESGASTGNPRKNIVININGHVIGQSGIAELTDMINQAVYENDVTLYASHATSGARLG